MCTGGEISWAFYVGRSGVFGVFCGIKMCVSGASAMCDILSWVDKQMVLICVWLASPAGCLDARVRCVYESALIVLHSDKVPCWHPYVGFRGL
jgi:hypothetical protein